MKYGNHLISFIDILGFSNLIDKEKNPAVIYDIMQTMRSNNNLIKRAAPKYVKQIDQKLLNFSDAIIRIIPLEDKSVEEQIDIIQSEITSIGMMQRDLLSNEIVIRGGMSMGPFYYSPDVFFGPSFVSAYNLESKIANFPRIIIDEKIMRLVDNHLKSKDSSADELHESIDIQSIKSWTDIDTDGYYFINYLYATYALSSTVEDELDQIEDHKELVISLREKPENAKFSNKYNWLIMYHNRYWNNKSKRINADFAKENQENKGKTLNALKYRIMKQDLKDSLFLWH